jgi:two-component system, NarL family, invasion response regulator UvrY
MRILIADDNELVRRGLIRLLSAETGWTVCGDGRDGLEALQQAQELLPDLILLDLRMPGLNGLEVTRRLRLELPEAKILLITQHDPERMWPSIVEAGGDACLDKGRLGTDLVTTIQSLSRA